MVQQFLVIGFKDNNSEGLPVIARPFMRSGEGGFIHFAESTEELQERLETLGDLSIYEKVFLQEANEV